MTHSSVLGFPGGSDGEKSACDEGDLGSIPGLGKIPWRRERLPTSVFWPGEFHGLYSSWDPKESDRTEVEENVFLLNRDSFTFTFSLLCCNRKSGE